MKNTDDNREYAGQTRIGKGMIIGAWIFLLLILTLFFNSYLERQNNPNSNPETFTTGSVKEVVLKRNRSGHYVASGMINGKAVTFLLDTGATDVAVSDELANSLGLRQGMPINSRTANGTVTAWQTTLSGVSIGDISLRDVRASILPSLDGDEVLLGMSFLQQLDMEQRGKHLLLRQH
jgi:aspartyl protease family protein